MSKIQRFGDTEPGKTSYTDFTVNVVKHTQKVNLLIE
jgi:hypothetical protein